MTVQPSSTNRPSEGPSVQLADALELISYLVYLIKVLPEERDTDSDLALIEDQLERARNLLSKVQEAKYTVAASSDYFHVECGRCGNQCELSFHGLDPVVPLVQGHCATCGSSGKWKLVGFRPGNDVIMHSTHKAPIRDIRFGTQ